MAGNVELTASSMPKEKVSVTTISLSLSYSEVSHLWGQGEQFFVFLVSFGCLVHSFGIILKKYLGKQAFHI